MLGQAASLAALVSNVRAGARLTTIAGLGGIGKTTLARELLAHLPSAVFVPLAGADELLQAIALVARAMEVMGDTDAEVDERLRRRWSQGGILVLDNLEHLLPEAAALVDAWTDRAPRLSIVATSRRRLGLPYETVIELGPLPLDDAVKLFVSRAGLSSPSESDLELVRHVVGALDGVPLAIELAAARPLPLTVLAGNVDDIRWLTGEARSGPLRHRSIDDLFEQSWDLLGPRSRDAMVELAAFRGGLSFTLAARFPELPELRAQGLVAVVDDRYRLLEIVRAFVEARGDVGAAQRRHAALFAAEAERRGALLPSNAAAEWLGSELENLAAAAARAVPDLSLRAALALDAALTVSHLPRRPELLEAALELGGTSIDVARGLSRLALARCMEGRIDVAMAERAWTAAAESGDAATQACAANALLRHLGALGRAHEAAAVARRFSEPREDVDPLLTGQVRAGAFYALPVAELAEAYPRWLHAAHEPAQRSRELTRFAIVLALSGDAERALTVLPTEGIEPATMRGHVLLAAERFLEARDAFERTRELAHARGDRLSEVWGATVSALAGWLAAPGDTRPLVAVDVHIDELADLGRVGEGLLVAAALAGAARARALLVVRRDAGDLAHAALDLAVSGALDPNDRERLSDAARVLDLRQRELPPADALDVLLVRLVVRARLAAPARRTLAVGPNGAWARLGDGSPVLLEGQHVLRRVLVALLDGERDVDDLFGAGWPGERARRDSAANRVRVTLARLRKLGLEGAIERGSKGWRIAPDIDVVHSADAAPDAESASGS